MENYESVNVCIYFVWIFFLIYLYYLYDVERKIIGFYNLVLNRFIRFYLYK